MEAVSIRGGAHLLEHPADPLVVQPWNSNDIASMWATLEYFGFQRRTDSVQYIFDQCMVGGLARKRTTMSTDLDGFGPGLAYCDGKHQHGRSSGKDSEGRYVSARLATYPSQLCRLIAIAVLTTLLNFDRTGRGPTGWKRCEVSVRRITQWSRFTSGGDRLSTAFLNETAIHGKGVVLGKSQAAIYVHVDDTATITSGSSLKQARLAANGLMHSAADALTKTGFKVTDRREAGPAQRIVGYELEESPARLRAPALKALMIRSALLFVASLHEVDTHVIRSLLGSWLWLALLRRELLSIPQKVFSFIDRFEGLRVTIWPSVRRELLAMAKTVGALYADVGAPLAPTICATDAMGADSGDCGGFGVVAADVPMEIFEDVIRLGARPGKALQRDLALAGRRNPDAPLVRTTPFTLLPPVLFDQAKTDWKVLSQGRWRWAEHITIGELRTVLRLLLILIADPATHRHKLISLQDNMAVAAILAKGRSSSPLLNFLLRRRAAYTVFAELQLVAPWVESEKQPADEASRDVSVPDRAPEA